MISQVVTSALGKVKLNKGTGMGAILHGLDKKGNI